MEGLLGWSNTRSNPHARFQMSEEIGRRSQVHALLRKVLRLYHCNRQGDL